MELYQLRQIVAITEAGSMTAAAQALHVSQPALSAGLGKLEKELGCPLFERQRSCMIPTNTGEIALDHAQKVLSNIEELQDEVRREAAKETTLFGVFDDTGPLWYCQPRFSLSAPHQKTDFRLLKSAESAKQLLLTGKVDFALLSEPIEDETIIALPLLHDRVMLSIPANHPLAHKSALSISRGKFPSVLYFEVGGAFHDKQMPFWEGLADKIDLIRMTDYFLFEQHARLTRGAVQTTFLASYIRGSDPERIVRNLVEAETSEELRITYYLSYLKENESEIESFIHCFAD